jgi:hypothetical protein
MGEIKQVGLFDMDDTLVDYSGGIVRSLNEIRLVGEPEYKIPIPRSDLNGRRVNAVRNTPGWWENLDRLQLGFDIYDLAKELGYFPYVLTYGPEHSPNGWTEKFNWCKREIPEASVAIVRDNVPECLFRKSLVYGRFLVDDYVEFQEGWLKHRPRGVGIMPAHKHNEGFSHPQVVRYDGTNLEEVKERLVWARDRK